MREQEGSFAFVCKRGTYEGKTDVKHKHEQWRHHRHTE